MGLKQYCLNLKRGGKYQNIDQAGKMNKSKCKREVKTEIKRKNAAKTNRRPKRNE